MYDIMWSNFYGSNFNVITSFKLISETPTYNTGHITIDIPYHAK